MMKVMEFLLHLTKVCLFFFKEEIHFIPSAKMCQIYEDTLSRTWELGFNGSILADS